MIPYLEVTEFAAGPLRIQAWGLFVAAGIAAALFVGGREASRRGLDKGRFLDMAAWILLAGIAGARLFHVFLYDPQPYLDDPWSVFRIWEGGMSIFGAFAGAGLAGWAYCRFAKQDLFQMLHAAAYALPLGCAIGRIGCFLIHDHPGVVSTSFLSVSFPGGSRLDHGLLLSLGNLLIFMFFLWLGRSGRRPPYLFWFMTVYGPFRFVLDFFRAWDLPQADIRFFWLTPAQYFSLLATVVGGWLLARSRRRPAAAVKL